MAITIERGDEVPVVDVSEMLDAAEHMGRDEFEGVDYEEADLDGFMQGARWANVIKPKLRAMTGYDDHLGKGTWVQEQLVVAIEPADRNDEPPVGSVVLSGRLLDEAIDAFTDGALEGGEGSEPAVDDETVIQNVGLDYLIEDTARYYGVDTDAVTIETIGVSDEEDSICVGVSIDD